MTTTPPRPEATSEKSAPCRPSSGKIARATLADELGHTQRATLADERGRTQRRAQPRGALPALCLAFSCVAFDNTKLVVAMPTFSRVFASEASLVGWIPEANLLVYASLLLLGGALCERYGARRMLLLGTAMFACGSGAGIWVSSAAALIAVRAFMAAGAALMTPATLAALKTNFGGEQRARAIACWTASYGAGAALGPVLGGLLLERGPWSSVLLINVPAAALAFVGAHLLLPRDEPPRALPVDAPGAALALVGTSGLIFAILEGPHLGWTSAPVLLVTMASASSYGWLISWSHRARRPMLDPVLLAMPRFRRALTVILLAYLAFSGVSFVIAQDLQLVRGFGPRASGLLALPLAAAMIAGTLLAPSFSNRVAPRRALVVSLVIAAAGAAGLALTCAHPRGHEVAFCLAMLPFAGGSGSAFVNATDVVIGIAPEQRAGSAAAVNETAFELGGAIGVAMLGTTLGFPSGALDQLASGAARAMWLGAGAFAFAAAIAGGLAGAARSSDRPLCGR